jgi:hypothetical protein
MQSEEKKSDSREEALARIAKMRAEAEAKKVAVTAATAPLKEPKKLNVTFKVQAHRDIVLELQQVLGLSLPATIAAACKHYLPEAIKTKRREERELDAVKKGLF